MLSLPLNMEMGDMEVQVVRSSEVIFMSQRGQYPDSYSESRTRINGIQED